MRNPTLLTAAVIVTLITSACTQTPTGADSAAHLGRPSFTAGVSDVAADPSTFASEPASATTTDTTATVLDAASRGPGTFGSGH
jgi:hypothetical protein